MGFNTQNFCINDSNAQHSNSDAIKNRPRSSLKRENCSNILNGEENTRSEN